MTYDAALHHLEAVLAELARDDLELIDALRLFEDGVEQLRIATQALEAAEGRVRTLLEHTDGTLTLSDHGA